MSNDPYYAVFQILLVLVVISSTAGAVASFCEGRGRERKWREPSLRAEILAAVAVVVVLAAAILFF